MAIVGLDTVVYGVEDMDAARRFLADWGLKKVRSGRSGTTFETLQGTQVVVSPSSDGTSSPREVVWGVGSKRDRDRIARELARDRDVTVGRDGTVHSVDPNGFGIGFRPWRGRTLKPSHQPANTPGARPRISRTGTFYGRATPSRLGHVVFNVADFAEAERFYVERLGFVVSDRIAGRAVYLRCNVDSDHHNLFFLKLPVPRPQFNHLAFEVRDIQELFAGGTFLTDRGWKTEVGPGRHRASSAFFWYFHSPCGGSTEYFTDSDWLDARWKPRSFKPYPAHFAEWLLEEGVGSFKGREGGAA